MRTLLSIGVIACVLTGVITFLVVSRVNSNPYEIPKSVQSSIGFSSVLPVNLPPDSNVAQQPSYDSERKLLNTTVSVSGHAVVFSQQSRPEIDLRQIDAKDTYLVNAGSVYVLKGEADRLQAIVETSDSWININAPKALGEKSFRTTIESMAVIE